MKIAVVSRNPHKLEKHRETLRKYLQYFSDEPDVVVAVGGDGTFLAAERVYPGVPKLLIREESICNKCDWDDVDDGLQRVVRGQFSIVEFKKIVAHVKGEIKEAVNDIVIRNVHPTHAIRFFVWINQKKLPQEFIGDGIVIATAFGASGYFHSITRTCFTQGSGVAFNNTTVQHPPLTISASDKVTIEITRGFAHVAADNNPQLTVVGKGDKIHIQQSSSVARIIKFQKE